MNADVIVDWILTDQSDLAYRALAKRPQEDPVLLSLLGRAEAQPRPLSDLVSEKPRYVSIHASYTCDIGCKMCIAGYQDKTFLYDDYKYFLPEQLEALAPWIESGTHVFFVGSGETLDSPYIYEFVEGLKDKVSIVTTSGIPLTAEKATRLIAAGLNIINISMDGHSALGHGGGNPKYVQNVWNKIRMVQDIKEKMNSEFPVIGMHITVNRENLDELDMMMEQALLHGIRDVLLLPMTITDDGRQIDPEVRNGSFAVDYPACQKQLNEVIERWEPQGIRFSVHEYPRMEEEYPLCPQMDNMLQFHGKRDRPAICCGTLEMPLALEGRSPDEFWDSFPFRYLRYLHFASEETGTLPMECEHCWIMKPKNYFELWEDKSRDVQEGFNPYPVYQEASRLKQDKRFAEACLQFQKILDAPVEEELKGKAYFQMAEMRIEENDFVEALRLAELAVKYNFRHRRAWSYVYLLMQITGLPHVRHRRNKHKFLYRPEITPESTLT